MSENKETTETMVESGKIVFAEDVIATIAFLAAGEIEGVHAMSGTAMEGLTEKLGRKSYTKGVKIELGTEECAVDLALVVKYGFRIQEVCRNAQKAVKSAIETMTGLRVVEVNIMVQSIFLQQETKVAPKIEPPAPEPEPEVKPRVK
ncbi:MAG: Asp23/Gls24 family envelope stress response protein [Clostridiales bacterium]|nr:Asp23/Gls24 family envelope stress response protein [Clostridiales bacterium]